MSVRFSLLRLFPPPAVPQQIIPERAEVSAVAGPPFWPGSGCFGSGSNWATKPLSPKSSVTSHRTNQLSHCFVFMGFFCCHFLFSFILKFIFTANVLVGIMVNIVTLIVITVFCKRGFIIIMIIIIIIKGKTVLCCKEDNIVL